MDFIHTVKPESVFFIWNWSVMLRKIVLCSYNAEFTWPNLSSIIRQNILLMCVHSFPFINTFCPYGSYSTWSRLSYTYSSHFSRDCCASQRMQLLPTFTSINLVLPAFTHSHSNPMYTFHSSPTVKSMVFILIVLKRRRGPAHSWKCAHSWKLYFFSDSLMFFHWSWVFLLSYLVSCRSVGEAFAVFILYLNCLP